LSELSILELRGNTCIDKEFWPVPYSKTTIENELKACGAGYEQHFDEKMEK
jgi:hypothetical protein